MQCKRKYQWVKLPRCCLPQGKGVLGQWARLAARAAYRKGTGRYCGFENPVEPGMWAGGVVGLKSILGTKSRKAALETLEQLQALGYLSYSLDSTTKKLEYRLLDLYRGSQRGGERLRLKRQRLPLHAPEHPGPAGKSTLLF